MSSILPSSAHSVKPHIPAQTGNRLQLSRIGFSNPISTRQRTGSTKTASTSEQTNSLVPGADCPFTVHGNGTEKLHKCAMGYAAQAGVVGGLHSPRYVVVSPMDSPYPKYGTLRYAMEHYRDTGVYVTFARSMNITLSEPWLYVPSNSTIDGRGVAVTLSQGGVAIEDVQNVIVHNILVTHQDGDHDLMSIRNSQVVWVDHCRLSEAQRGTVDVVYGSTDVTLSNNHIHNKKFTMLLGASDNSTGDVDLRVTVYRNWFDQSGQRQPHCRWGKCHVANNLYTEWEYYCIGARVHANVRSEANIFVATDEGRKEVTPWFGLALHDVGFDYTPTIRSVGDWLVNGATFHEFPGVEQPLVPPYEMEMHDATLELKEFLIQNVGPIVS